MNLLSISAAFTHYVLELLLIYYILKLLETDLSGICFHAAEVERESV